jgi:hypothetical protein
VRLVLLARCRFVPWLTLEVRGSGGSSVTRAPPNPTNETCYGVSRGQHARHAQHESATEDATNLRRKHNGRCGHRHTDRTFSKIIDFHTTALSH